MSTSEIYTHEQYMDESPHVHRHMYTQHNFREVLCVCYFCVVVNGMPIRNERRRERLSLLLLRFQSTLLGRLGQYHGLRGALLRSRSDIKEHCLHRQSVTFKILPSATYFYQSGLPPKGSPAPSNRQEFKIRQWGAFQSEIMTPEQDD